jgi:prepilin-type processing-associated H-X9-DG protein
MRPDLLGFVLKALDPPAQAGVEAHLSGDPTALGQVEALRLTLEPLSWDAAGDVPTPGLAERTLAHVAAYAPGRRKVVPGLGAMPWRRFFEIAAVALVAVTSVGVGLTWLSRLRGPNAAGEPNATQLVACQNNLREVFGLLRTYGDSHNGQFPSVAAAVDPPRNVAGLVFSILHDNSLLPANLQLVCPAAGGPAPSPVPLNDVKAINDGAYEGWAQSLQHSYAYSLGYRQEGQLVGPCLEHGQPSSLMPLMADSSPPDPGSNHQSPNHGGSGQNVLYCDGHVAFCQSRYVGYNRDDIYLNRANKVAAGIDWSDAVLTSGAVPP